MGFFNKLFDNETRPKTYNYQTFYAYAKKQEAKGNIAEAMECYEIIQKKTPGFEDTYPHLFKYYEQTKQWEKLQKVAHYYDSDLRIYHRDDSTGRVYELKAVNALEKIKRAKYDEKCVVKSQPQPVIESTIKRCVGKPKEVRMSDDSSANMNGKFLIPADKPIIKEAVHKSQEPKTTPIPQQVISAKKKEEITPKYPTKANYKRVLMENSGDKLEELKSKLPEYDFYTGDNNSLISDDVREAIINWQFGFEDLMLKAQDYEKNKDFASAASVYEKMVGMKCILREPYERLMAIYEKAELNADFKEFVEYSFRFFSDRALNYRNYLRAMAQKYDSFDLAETMIEKGKVVAYFDGLFDIYNPFPWLYDWNKKRL